MSDLAAHRTTSDVAGRVTLGLTMIDRGRAAIIRDRYWRERTWPAIAKDRHCSVTTAVKRFKQGMDDLKGAILLIEGRLPLDDMESADQGGASIVVRTSVS
jgi:hypothetical protein